jgi:hypothetical protein
MLKPLLRTLALLAITAAIAVALLLGTAQRYLETPVTLSADSMEWTIGKGGNLNTVNRKLFH